MSGDLKEGMEDSKGDPRVLFVLNVLLSTIFAYGVLYLSDLVGVTTFSWEGVAGFALLLILLTHVVTRQ